MITNTRIALKQHALRLAVTAVVVFGPGLDANAQTLTYDFNDATLQGWNNRVWNGSAWIDLAPNATTYAGTLLPASGNNGLFVPASSAVWVSGNTDAHLNTLWLRSPQFYLNGTGNLTVQMAKGQAYGPAPANDASVSYIAQNSASGSTGWKGVALRRVSDGVFVLAKPRVNGGNDTFLTVTFTQAELAPYVGIACTLDLINSENGGWGWLTMDNVSIPGDTALPGQGKDITSFTFPTYGAATISGTNISLTVPYGTAVTNLAPTFTISALATANPVSGTARNFTTPQTYTVTAQDTSTKVYTVTVTVTPASTAKDIVTFGPGATIAGTSITWAVPYGTSVTALAPTYTVSTFATGAPASGATRNFSTPQTYTVTSQDGSSKVYTVTVSVTPASSAKTMLTFGPGAAITGTNIAWAVAYGTDVTSLTPSYTVSPFAVGTPPLGTALNFTTPQTYTVTAQDGSSQAYRVTVSVLPDGPEVINVNYTGGSAASMDGIYSSDGAARGSASRTAPAVYGGNKWNDFNNPAASGSGLKDSKGTTTAVGLTTTMQGGPWADWTGLGGARMLISGVIAGYVNYSNIFTLSGLDMTHTYELHIASLHSANNRPVDFMVGATVKHVANSPSGSTDWAEGTNYVRFTGLVPDGGGTVTVQAKTTSDYFPLNGFQLRDTTPQKDLLSFTFPTFGAATISGSSVSMSVPYGTSVTALAPSYAVSYGATCVPASGTAQNFSSPVHYVVTASDSTTKDYPVTVSVWPFPSPVFTLVASTNQWDGRQTMTVTPSISNWSLLQALGATNLTYTWSVAGVAASKQVTPGTLTLLRSQGNGPMTVKLVLDNGGWRPSTNTVTVTVQQPASDPWVQRTPGATEKPVDGQFFARDNAGLGRVYYNGTQAGSPDTVFLKVYTTQTGSDVLYSTLRQPLVGGAYAFTAPIAAGLFTYKVVFGTTTGGVDTPVATVTNLVCGDAYIIEGQSNAVAETPNNGTPPEADYYTSPWIRSYGNSYNGTTNGGWGTALRTRTWGSANYGMYQIGAWGIDLGSNLLAKYSMPICMINGAVGGTRIDQHLANPADHYAAGSAYSIYANLLNRVAGAKLTHGIRGVLWHQGEQDQGHEGPFGGDYDYKWYQQNFVDLSAAWKQDYPNIQNYYTYQIWPSACGDGSANDLLRETQRTLPSLYSNLRIMTTVGIVPGSSCHYVLDGYMQFSVLLSPLVEQDNYGLVPSAAITAADVKRAWYTTTARNEIALEFGQDMAWNNASAGLFYLDYQDTGHTGVSGNVASGSVSGHVIKLQLSTASTAQTITYLVGGSWNGNQPNLLYGSNGIAALTFAMVPIAPPGTAVAPVIGSLAPASGRTNGGTVVTFTGANFQSGATVQFGGLSATAVNVSSPTQMTATTPAHAPGLVSVTVWNTSGLSATNQFTYLLPQPSASLAGVGQSGTNLTMVWVGAANQPCVLLSATNAAQPRSTWIPVATNAIGPDGRFTNSIPVRPGDLQRLFLLSFPYN